MRSTKLWRVFSLLNAYERNELDKFLRSPFFNHRRDVLHLYQVLMESDASRDLTKETVWNTVFPGVPFQRPEFNRLNNRLLNLIESYLSRSQQTSQRVIDAGVVDLISLTNFYQSRQAEDLAQSLYRREEKRMKAESLKGSGHFLNNYLLSREIYNTSAPQQKRYGEGLQQLSLTLDDFYFLEKLKQACSLSAQKSVSSEAAPIDLLEEVLDRIESGDRLIPPLIKAYGYAYRMLEGADGREEFEELLDLLSRHKPRIPMHDQRAIYLMAINFCIRKLNLGEQPYLRQVYELYQIGIEDKWLFEQGNLSPWTYKNIVSAGLKLKEHKEVAAFIEKYRDHLPEESREAYYLYNLAELQMALKNYREVLRNLRFIQFKEPLTQLRSRILMVKASFELGDHPLAEYQLTAFQKLLRRRKSLAYHRENYLQFVRLARRILTLEPDAMDSRLSIRNEIENAEAVVERIWLLEKVANFM